METDQELFVVHCDDVENTWHANLSYAQCRDVRKTISRIEREYKRRWQRIEFELDGYPDRAKWKTIVWETPVLMKAY
jgi:hypothetical protein